MTNEHKANILIIDDNVVIRYMLRHVLVGAGHSIVGEADGGEAGLALAKELKPDVICLDVLMPGTGGLETLKLIKEQLPFTSVLMVTGNNQNDTLMSAVRGGADGYIVKPFKPDSLLQSVEHGLEKQRARMAAASATTDTPMP